MAQNVLLLNDSFPPLIDGVANAVMNYGESLPKYGYTPTVVTPDHPEADDTKFPYDVVRYPSIDLRKISGGYMAGLPFSPEVQRSVAQKNISLIHTHCPIVSTMLARQLRETLKAPIVLTYHTKFDIDIANLIKSEILQEKAKQTLVKNISACDEIWAVSQGAADNLRSLGFEGSITVMPNGVDLPRGRVSDAEICKATAGYDLPEGVPVFLFVGRMMWYKGLRMILDALAKLKADNVDYRMVFIGGGQDFDEVKAYSEALLLGDRVIFTGPIRGRDTLRAWYCRSSLFLFPSTFDTNGLVVREAAACALGAMLIKGSCAAEGVTDGRNGILIEENAESMYEALKKLCANPSVMADVGEHAARELYMSWEDAVKLASARYGEVIEQYRAGGFRQHHAAMDGVFRIGGEAMEDLAHIQAATRKLNDRLTMKVNERLEEIRDWME